MNLAVVGAGPVGLALALHAARALPAARITLFDARPADKGVSADPRTLALSLGSVQLLQRIGAWRAESAQAITEVHVSQQPPSLGGVLASFLGEPEVRIRAIDEAVPMRGGKAALVWCVASEDDPVAELDDAQRLIVLNTQFHPEVGRVASMSPLKRFPLGLNAERTLTDGRTVRIGNAAQTLHPVAGQGLNLGLRDAFELVRALSKSRDVDAVLRRLEWKRGPDRWAMIAATDFLARSFTWRLPGAGAARGRGMAGLRARRPVESALARQMMFCSR